MENGLSNSSNGLSKYSDLISHQWRMVSQIPPSGLLKFPCGHQSETLKKNLATADTTDKDNLCL